MGDTDTKFITLTEQEAQRALGAAIAAKLGHDVKVHGYEVQFGVDLLQRHIQVEFSPAPTPHEDPLIDFSQGNETDLP